MKKKKKNSSCQQNRKSVLLCKKNRLALDLSSSSSSNCSYFHATFMRLLFLSATHTDTHKYTQTPLPFSCWCCCCCCRCHCRCPCAYCATMHNALGFLSAFLCLKLSATLTLCTLCQRERDSTFHCWSATKDLIQRSLTQGHDPAQTPHTTQLTDSITQRCLLLVAVVVVAAFNANGDNSQCKKALYTVSPHSLQHVPCMESTFHDVQKG